MATTYHDVPIDQVFDDSPLSLPQAGVLIMCLCVATLEGFDTQCIGYLAPSIAETSGLSLAGFGPVFVAGLVGLMIGSSLLGPLADTFGRKWAAVGSTLAFGVASLLSSLATSLETLILLRFLTGLGIGYAFTTVLTVVTEFSPKRLQAVFVPVMATGMPLGAGIAGLASTLLLPVWGWRSVFVAGGILPVILAAVLAVWMPESVRFLVSRGGDQARIRRIVARMVKGRTDLDRVRFVPGVPASTGLPIRHLFTEGRAAGTLLLWVACFMNLLIIYFAMSWLPAVLKQAGLDTSASILTISLFSIGGVVGSFLQGLAMRLVGGRRWLAIEFAVAMLLIPMLGVLPLHSVALPATTLVIGVVVQGAQGGLFALAAGYYPTAIRSTGFGWALAAGRAGSLVGPSFGGLILSSNWTLRTIFLLGALPALCAGLAVILGGLIGGRGARDAEQIESVAYHQG